MFGQIGSLLAYIGPETILPFSSMIAAIAGGVMLFWNKLRLIVIRWSQRSNVEASDK